MDGKLCRAQRRLESGWVPKGAGDRDLCHPPTEDYIMRDIREVMQNINDLCPADVQEEFRVTFAKFNEDLFYTAPEAMHIRWAQLEQIVEDIVGAKPFETWHYKVIGELMAIDPKVALDIFG